MITPEQSKIFASILLKYLIICKLSTSYKEERIDDFYFSFNGNLSSNISIIDSYASILSSLDFINVWTSVNGSVSTTSCSVNLSRCIVHKKKVYISPKGTRTYTEIEDIEQDYFSLSTIYDPSELDCALVLNKIKNQIDPLCAMSICCTTDINLVLELDKALLQLKGNGIVRV